MLEKLDIIVLTECWLSEKSVHNLDGFYYFSGCSFSNQSSGVCVFVKDSIKCTCIDISKKNVFDGITINFIFGSQPIELHCFYRSPSFNKQCFYDYLYDTFRTLNEKKTIEIITGDLNINTFDNNESLEDDMNSMGFFLCNREPTRENKLIDHFFIRNQEPSQFIYSSENLDTSITDHCAW